MFRFSHIQQNALHIKYMHIMYYIYISYFHLKKECWCRLILFDYYDVIITIHLIVLVYVFM